MGSSVLYARRAFCASQSLALSRKLGLECKTLPFSDQRLSQAVVLVARWRMEAVLCWGWLAVLHLLTV